MLVSKKKYNALLRQNRALQFENLQLSAQVAAAKMVTKKPLAKKVAKKVTTKKAGAK